MIIDLKAIDRSPKHFDLIFDKDWWPSQNEDSQVVGLSGPLNCPINIVEAGVKYILDGVLSGSITLCCDRCLENYQRNLKYAFRILLTADRTEEGKGELELSEEDMHIHFISGYEVDLEDVVREQIYMSLPMKSLCSEQCSGLCPKCGANLNLRTCACRQREGHPAFAKLEALKLRK